MNKYKKIEIGDKYGRWTVKSYVGKRKVGKQNKDYWNCECECGTNRDVLGEILKNGRSTSCGCLTKENTIIAGINKRTVLLNIGEMYGNWKVLEYSGKSPYTEGNTGNTYLCECQCEWHTKKILYASHLKNGNTTSCKKCSNILNIVGNKYGKLKVLKLDTERMDLIKDSPKQERTYYICQCDCGKILSVRQDSILSRGDSASCGCEKFEFKDLSGKKFHMLTILDYYDTVEMIGKNYKVHRRRWRCKCDCGKIKIIREEDLLGGSSTSCGCRSDSKSEAETKRILDNWGVKYFTEYRFEDCKYKNCLPFDFYIPDKKICIELDGEDHYKPINRADWSEEETLSRFETRKQKDKIKTEYCKSHKIKLIRIPYWDFDDIEYILFDKLVKYKVIEEIKAS